MGALLTVNGNHTHYLEKGVNTFKNQLRFQKHFLQFASLRQPLNNLIRILLRLVQAYFYRRYTLALAFAAAASTPAAAAATLLLGRRGRRKGLGKNRP